MDESTAQLLSEGAVSEPHNEATGTGAEGERGGGREDQKNEEDEESEEEELVGKAQLLMDKVTASPDNPNPSVLHSLASLLESQESRYLKEHDYSSTNARASHTIGRLGNLVRDNDEFFELVSSRYLSEARFSTSVQAASARLLMSCSPTWMYPHVFEEAVLENVKAWVMDDTARSLCEASNLKLDLREKVSDHEMLKTYSTGLLAMSLVGGGPLVEDALTCGLSAKLMRYLRVRVLGDASQRDSPNLAVESKNASAAMSKGREESRVRVRQLVAHAHLDDSANSRYGDDFERNQDRVVASNAYGENSKIDVVEPPDVFREGLSTDMGPDGEDKMYSRDSESSRRRLKAKSKGKGRLSEGVVELEDEHGFVSPGSGGRLGQMRINRDKSLSRYSDVKKVPDVTKPSNFLCSDGLESERDDSLFYIEEFRIGNRDISEIVKQAVRAAEAEARAANAPAGAIKAAAAAAAEVVKTAALEEFRNSTDEEAAVLAASKAASTVVDAANAVEVSRSSNTNADATDQATTYSGPIEDAFEYFIPDTESLAQLREKYCIQCLEILGEYVEVLGPVLHEKGVDVCLALLQQNSASKETSKGSPLLPEVMKLICALAAHRKFAALFVDRGGMQKLLAMPRVSETFFGLSSCLFTIGSIQGIMERVCALPLDVVSKVVVLAIQLLECSQDQARKNAALFFAAAFVFRAVLDAFDAQDGLQKLLGVLNDAASVRSGVSSGSLSSSNSGPLRHDRLPAEVLTSSEKQIAYHTCVALRQYFRAHLLLIVDSIRPTKSNRSAPRNTSSIRAAYKPLDISNEAIDAVFLQLQKDRKLGPAFVRTRWPAVDKFLASNGHQTLLELCQAPPVERYLHDLLQYALGVLHIITLVPHSRKMIVNATLSNDRLGIAVILDAANIASSFLDPEIVQPALHVLINLVCPPPSISNKPSVTAQGQQSASGMDVRDRNVDRIISDRPLLSNQGDGAVAPTATSSLSQAATSGLVGDRRISLGAGAGCAGLAAQLEQGYRLAREAVRANNGIKVLLHLLQPRVYSSPSALDCLRALACRVLLGLARDDTIAHILTKLQIGKKLSELIRDTGSQSVGGEQARWQAELAQVAIELIAIVTNSGRASSLAATDAAIPTLRRIERAAIAAATPITYHSRELLLLIHEHLQASGLLESAGILLKEAQLTPLPSLAGPQSLSHQTATTQLDSSVIPLQWPSARTPGGFLSEKLRLKEDLFTTTVSSSKKKPPPYFSSTPRARNQPPQLLNDFHPSSSSKKVVPGSSTKQQQQQLDTPTAIAVCDTPPPPPTGSLLKASRDVYKTPIILPMKRKHSELKDTSTTTTGSIVSGKRMHCSSSSEQGGLRSPICLTPHTNRKTTGLLLNDACGLSTPTSCQVLKDSFDDNSSYYSSSATPHHHTDPAAANTERLTLDSVVVQYLKHQHRQCPAPITTLPPLSLLHPHVCPEPKRSLDAPLNVTARLGTREYKSMYGGVHGNRRDRQFVFSRFRPWRTCRDDAGGLFTCIAFAGGDSGRVAVGSHSGEIKIFDTNNNSVLESFTSHQASLTLVQSSGTQRLLLSSSTQDVRLWDASSISSGPLHPFEGCKNARFSNSGTHFAALSSEGPSRREILLFDIQTYQMELKLSDTSTTSATGRGHAYSLVHFSPSDAMVLWNGVLWDRRLSGPVHRFDQFTDYGGGGFHPAGNEVIINSEVWDLRKFRLLRSVPSLDQTAITFNARGDVIYAILRRNLEDPMSAVHTRRVKHPLFAAFRTIDAVNYSDIATVPVDRCVLDLATEPTDSSVGLMTMDDQDDMLSSARMYEIGRRKPTDDDSDPDDAESEEEEDDEDDDDDDDDDANDPILGGDLDDSDSSMSNGDDMSDLDDDDDDADFMMDDDAELDGGAAGLMEILTEGDDDDEEDDDELVDFSSGDEQGNGFGF